MILFLVQIKITNEKVEDKLNEILTSLEKDVVPVEHKSNHISS